MQKPPEYILGIECDGAQYHSSIFARDRDKVRQAVLERLGWNIHRIWSEDWLRNRSHEIDKIKNKVGGLLKSGGSSQPVEKATFKEIDDVDNSEEVSLDQQYERYQMADLPLAATILKFDSRGNLVGGIEEAVDLLMQTIKIESPIEKGLLFRRVLDSYGMKKLGQRLNGAFETMLKHMKYRSLLHIDGDTVSIERIDGVVPVRVSSEEQRPFVYIPKEELGGAIIDILRNTYSIDKDALVSDIAKGIYGNNRTGSKIRQKADKAIKYLKDKKMIIEENGVIKLSK